MGLTQLKNSLPIDDTAQRKNVDLYQSIATTGVEENRRMLYKPEILSPAGGWPQARAAVANGADAIYFGLQEGFNARARASNFAIDELPALMEYLHERGVKGYTVVNVLVFDEEMSKLEELIKKLAIAGVDALIMQDIGAAAFARKVAPSLPVHGSTQMTITDSNGALFAEKLGIDRVVVGRELSLTEIDSVSRKSGVEVEAFVHGALCVSYSGQCFSSEAWGGRSANRGQCAQACRLPYGLVVNGTLRDLHDVAYLLSPQDLMAVELVPQLIKSGVRSFKIEGRLKGPEYVAITTRAYREAVDQAWDALVSTVPGASADSRAVIYDPQQWSNAAATFTGPDANLRQELRQVFSRGQDEEHDGLSAGFLLGVKHQTLVRGRNPRHRGLLIGKVQKITSRGVVVALSGPVKRGDGMVFDCGKPEEHEEGGAVYDVYSADGKNQAQTGESRDSGNVLLTFGSRSIDLSRIHVGDLLWKNKDHALETQLKALAEQGDQQTVHISAHISGSLGTPLTITLKSVDPLSGQVHQGSGVTTFLLAEAKSRPTTQEEIFRAIGTFGDTPLAIKKLASTSESGGFQGLDVDFNQFNVPASDGSGDASSINGLFIPAGEIKAARREAVKCLLAARRVHTRGEGIKKNSAPILPEMRAEASLIANSVGQGLSAALEEEVKQTDASNNGAESTNPEATLNVLCRTPQQALAASRIPWLKEVTLDFLEVHGLREAVGVVQAAGKKAIVATPRIIKPDEERLYTFYLRLRADAILVRSAGFLQQLNDLGGPGSMLPQSNIPIPELRGDFSLNAANLLSTAILLKAGLARLTPTHDLNADQISDLGVLLGDASMLEVVAYQHLPIFHTEHCVFCKFLSNGNSYKDCGHPCETNQVHLRGMDGQDNLVLADQGCRNTVFNAQAQSGAEYLAKFQAAGIRHFRIEFVDEDASSVEPILSLFRAVTQGEPGAEARLQEYLNQVPNSIGSRQGFTSGSLKPVQEKSRGKLKTTAAEKKAKAAL